MTTYFKTIDVSTGELPEDKKDNPFKHSGTVWVLNEGMQVKGTGFYDHRKKRWYNDKGNRIYPTAWLKPITEPLFTIEQVGDAFDSGRKYGEDQENIITPDGQIYPNKEQFLNSIK